MEPGHRLRLGRVSRPPNRLGLRGMMSLNSRPSNNSFVAHAAPPLFLIIDVKDRRLMFLIIVIIIIVLRLPARTDAINGRGDIVAVLPPIRSPSVCPQVIGSRLF